ncbi:hypothetical protein [Tropicibacter sp. S64]|uniref:hypothetical protein n=1 Tax=Tropicibacter sp. S64 TaxID=3415122 RepID=UPI003C7BE06C
MTASPAQIANDMAAHADYWEKRDKHIARTCRDARDQIRALLAGEHVDGRSWGGLHRRLLNWETQEGARHYQGFPQFCRARLCLEQLRREAGL